MKEFANNKKNGEFTKAENTEKLISIIEEEKTIKFLEKLPIWEILEKERISKTFCSLAKISSREESLSIVQGENGYHFGNEKERSFFINNYYQKIYEKIETTYDIEGFLGDNILSKN